MSKTLILVDAMNLAYRSHYAMPTLTNEEGTRTGMCYGFIRSILGIKKQFLSDRIVVCWDSGIPGGKQVRSWRYELSKTYKATRKRNAETEFVISKLPELVSVIETIGWLNVGVPTLEGDDIIGIICGARIGAANLVCSGDQDFYQLLTMPHVRIVYPTKYQGNVVVDKGLIETTHKITLEQWPAFIALGGDASDNIKAIPGVGAKRGLDMIRDGFDPSLRDHRRLPSEVKAKYARYLNTESWARIRTAYKLALIPTDARDVGNGTKQELSTTILRVRDYCDNNTPKQKTSARLTTFSRWCADNDMNEFLERRREILQ